ncbi:MAG: transporter substrate-binding protein, partial [Clostridia bacterium]|nr:transporter substrate-binding protein [Clostridia bacterium]
MKFKKLLTLLLFAAMSVSVFTGCSGYTSQGTLVLGATEFNGVFSPFFGTTGYDMEISDLVQLVLIKNDRAGTPISNAAEYKTPVENKDEAGNIISTTYTFKLKSGLKFSDGKPVTADDIIFSYKVLCDPNYDGPSTIYTTPILGINEYRYDDADYTAKIADLHTQSEAVTDDEVKAKIISSCTNDYDSYGAEEINNYTGFVNTANLEGDALKQAEIDAYVQIEIASYWDDYKAMAIEDKFAQLEKAYIEENLSSGEIKVPEIEGIKKINESTVEVTIEGVDPKAIWNLGGISVAPKHYYGVGKDGTEFSKGKIDIVKEKNAVPLGAGPYLFEKFEDNVVTLNANPDYFKGQPSILTLKYQVTAESNKIEGVKLGNFDISDPTANQESIDAAT